jgi:hypothetical protein
MIHLREFEEEFPMDDLKDLNKMGFQKLKGWIFIATNEGSVYSDFILVCEESEEKAASFVAGSFYELDVEADGEPIYQDFEMLGEVLVDNGYSVFNTVFGPFEVKPEILEPCYSSGPSFDPYYFKGQIEKYLINPEQLFKEKRAKSTAFIRQTRSGNI